MEHNADSCKYRLMAARDALEIVQGKWRIPIVISLTFGDKRFGEIQRDIPDISPKMLAQELKALEANKLLKRSVHDTMPVTVEYSLTPLGESMNKLIEDLLNWGVYFRQEVLGK